MIRRAASVGHTMGWPKLDGNLELARSINPEIKLDLLPKGIIVDNLEWFLACAEACAVVIDLEKGQ